MNLIKKAFISILMVSLINVYFPVKIFAQEAVGNIENEITEYEPESSTAEEKILPGKGNSRLWIWLLIALAAIGGVAAAVTVDDSDGGSNDQNTGSFETAW